MDIVDLETPPVEPPVLVAANDDAPPDVLRSIG